MARDGDFSNRIYNNDGYRTVAFGTNAVTTDPSGALIGNAPGFNSKKHSIESAHLHNITKAAKQQAADNSAMDAFTGPLNI
jgi:hypothetical protein